MAGMPTRIEHIKNEIKARQEELKRLEDLRNLAICAVRPLEEVTVEEKIAFFDACYGAALEDLEYARSNSVTNEDSDHYSWEYMMETLAWPGKSKDFWIHYNSYVI